MNEHGVPLMGELGALQTKCTAKMITEHSKVRSRVPSLSTPAIVVSGPNCKFSATLVALSADAGAKNAFNILLTPVWDLILSYMGHGTWGKPTSTSTLTHTTRTFNSVR